MASPAPFGVILAGRPVLTQLETHSPTQFSFSFPETPAFSHIVVFLMPGITIPDDLVASVYIQLPGQTTGFGLLGSINNSKPSAIFRFNARTSDQMDSTITLGISVEPVSAEAMPGSLVLSRSSKPLTTKVLAQRIIKNAFNFLASFAGNAAGEEVVPLKSFQDWWTKFERRVELDPSFLEKDEGP